MNVHTPISAAVVLIASGVSAYLVARRLRLPCGKATRALATLVLWEAFQIVPTHLLASLQLMRAIPAVSVCILALVELVIAVLVAGMWPTRTLNAPEQRSSEPLPSYLIVAVALLGCSYLALAVNVLSAYPAGADSVIYHLPLAARWLQTGSLSIPASHAWRFSLPGNAEIGMMVLLSSGWQAAAIAASWIPAAMVAVSVYLLAMWMSGRRRTVAVTCALLAMSIPIIESQAMSTYVDLLATAGMIAALALFVTALGDHGENTRALWLLSGLACGISVGTKPVYYLYAAWFCVFVVSIVWVKRRTVGGILKPVALLMLGILLPSLFWFARGVAQTGNPVYPMQVKVANRVIFPGYARSEITELSYEFSSVQRSSFWFIYPWTEWKRETGYLKVPYGEGDGVGAAFAAFVPLGMVYFLLQLGRDPRARMRNLLLILAFATMFASWWLVMQRVLRFGELIAVFTCVLAVPLLTLLQSKQRAFAALLVIAIAMTSLIVASVPLHLLAGRVRKHLWSRAEVYNYPQFIDDLPPGSVVVNATGAQDRNFALLGSRLSNRVITSFEAPVSVQGLHELGSQYVVETLPSGLYSDEALQAAGAILVDDQMVSAGEDRVRWKIWKLR